MKKLYLDGGDSGKLVRGFQLFFGIVCIAVAIAWIILYPGSVKTGLSFWISFLFLTGFGIFQVNSGIGRGRRFVVFEETRILFKSIPLLPPHEINPDEIERISIFPLNILFTLKNKRNVRIRLGTTHTDVIRPLKDAVAGYAEGKKITVEFEQEDI
ncbi:MAG: EbsA family protein [Bacteroidales bacterium]|nr:EbsA family protein [Bacteroidales bacterium]